MLAAYSTFCSCSCNSLLDTIHREAAAEHKRRAAAAGGGKGGAAAAAAASASAAALKKAEREAATARKQLATAEKTMKMMELELVNKRFCNFMHVLTNVTDRHGQIRLARTSNRAHGHCHTNNVYLRITLSHRCERNHWNTTTSCAQQRRRQRMSWRKSPTKLSGT